MLKPYKFHVFATVQEIDEEGGVLGERVVADADKPVTVFGVDALKAWADAFPGQLEKLEESPTD